MRPDFPPDAEFLARLGSCYRVGFEGETDFEAVAERVLATELAPEDIERIDAVLRLDIVLKFQELKRTRPDFPSREVFERKLSSCSIDELRRLKNMAERVELVLSKS
jgi:hypothetical protein